jgi:hypothetical protein
VASRLLLSNLLCWLFVQLAPHLWPKPCGLEAAAAAGPGFAGGPGLIIFLAWRSARAALGGGSGAGYASVEEAGGDVALVWANCRLYNAAGSRIW